MSRKALVRYKEIVDRIEKAFCIGDIEGQSALEDLGPKLDYLRGVMTGDEQDQAAKYLKQVSKQHKEFVMAQEDFEDDEEEEDEEDCSGNWSDIPTERRRELVKIACELSEEIDKRGIAKNERCFLLNCLDNLAR